MTGVGRVTCFPSEPESQEEDPGGDRDRVRDRGSHDVSVCMDPGDHELNSGSHGFFLIFGRRVEAHKEGHKSFLPCFCQIPGLCEETAH